MSKISAFLLITLCCVYSSSVYADDDTLQRIEVYLNSLTTITADFTQAAPDGSIATGRFYLQRPGKMRWEYDPPTPILMVSNGSTITYFDRELAQISHISLDSTLAGFLARPVIAFSGDVTIDSLTNEAGAVRVTVHQTEKTDEGNLTLEFSDKPLVIRSLIVKDSAGQITQVAFQDAHFGQPIDQELFVFRDPSAPRRR